MREFDEIITVRSPINMVFAAYLLENAVWRRCICTLFLSPTVGSCPTVVGHLQLSQNKMTNALGDVVCYTAVFSVVTQRSSPLNVGWALLELTES